MKLRVALPPWAIGALIGFLTAVLVGSLLLARCASCVLEAALPRLFE